MTGLTWKIGTFIMAGLLAFVGVVGLIDGISNRATIRELRSGNEKLAGWLGDAQRNVGTCHGNVANLDQSLKDQGKDIRDLSKASADNDKNARERMAGLEAQGRGVRAEVQRLASLPRPAPENACNEAERVLRGKL